MRSNGQVQTGANQGRKDAETREKQPRNNSADLGVGLVSPQEIHIFEFFYSTKTPNKRKMLAFFIPEKV